MGKKESVFSDDSILEAIFRQAVVENYERELDELEKAPDIPVSDLQKRRMDALFAGARRETRVAVVIPWIKRLTAVAAALFVAVGLLLLTVPAVRASVGEALAVFFDVYVRFGPVETDAPDDGAADWRPSFLPDGFALESEFKPGEITALRYADAEGNVIEFTFVPADNAMSANYEHVAYSRTSRDGIVYHTFTAESDGYKSAVVWDFDGYIFSVTGYLPVEQLLEIAQSAEGK
ncbi:MAG: DUF4367 domain-containing protein [Oscillospiraceae bacterium]|jgi:hypothetical protein|nr:DUF4367 domain-containing protein [Oscillospiraceae bacterium]